VSSSVIAGAASGPYAAACVVLAFAGATKIRRPAGTRPAAAALGLPDAAAVVRSLGAVEVALGAAGLVVGGAVAAVVAAMFGALAIAAWRLLARSPGTACGCLGTSDAPVSVIHIVVNMAAAVAAALAAGARAPLSAVGAGVSARIAFVLLVGCTAWLVATVLEVFPTLNAATRPDGSQ